MPIVADLFGLTDTGKVREANEDQFLIAELSKSLLIVQTSLAQDAALQSLSFYVSAAAGKLRLGLYSDNGGAPATLERRSVCVSGLLLASLGCCRSLERSAHPAGTLGHIGAR